MSASRTHATVWPSLRAQVFRPMPRLVLSLLLATVVFLADSAEAQGERTDDPQRIAEARARKQAATETFLDPHKPKAARLEAATQLGYPEDETFEAMLRLGADPNVEDEIRLQALARHPFDLGYLDVVLGILESAEEGGSELVADLIENLSRRTTFRLPAPIEQRILAALRALLDDPREGVRVAAFRSLIGGHDTVAVHRLVEALNVGEDEVPIPLAEAIHLLDLNGSIYHIQTLQPFLDHEDPIVQAQAARALAVDPSRRAQIVAMAVGKTEPEEVRVKALRALAREDQDFAHYGIELVEDRAESAAVRYAAMKFFAGRMNYREVQEEDQIRFAEAVEAVLGERALESQDGKQLQQEASKLLAYLQKAFPAVESHYAPR